MVDEKQNDAPEAPQPNASSLADKLSGLSLGVKGGAALVLVLLVGILVMSIGNTGSDEAVDDKPKAATTSETVVTTEAIGFSTDTKDDPNRLEGETTITKPGVMGSARVTYDVYNDGRKIEVSRQVLKDPVNEKVLKGTKPPPITNTSWDVLRVGQFTIAPMSEKVAVVKRYLTEHELKGPGFPWQDPQWLVSKMDVWAKDNKDKENTYLEWEFGNRISEWRHEELVRKASTLQLGSSMDEVKAVLGEPHDTRRTDLPGSSIMDYYYYGPVGNRVELAFSAGRLESITN